MLHFIARCVNINLTIGGVIKMGNRRISLLKRIYRLLDNVTPIDGDCGNLCGARCCKGGDHDGMWLLPDEDLLLKDADFLTIHETLEGKYAICNGHCDRKLRPIACRIFPYFPMLFRTRNGSHSVKPMPDLRALAACALFDTNAPQINPEFKQAVHRAGMLMMQDRCLRGWLSRTGEYIFDIGQMRQMLEA